MDGHLQLAVMLLERSADRLQALLDPLIRRPRLSEQPAGDVI
jgi:hypothetical protein